MRVSAKRPALTLEKGGKDSQFRWGKSVERTTISHPGHVFKNKATRSSLCKVRANMWRNVLYSDEIKNKRSTQHVKHCVGKLTLHITLNTLIRMLVLTREQRKKKTY